MRPSFVVSLLLFSFLLQGSQGIRLEKGFMQVRAQKVQENNSNSLKEISTGVPGEEVILCEQGNCIGTMIKKRSVSRSLSKKSLHHWLPSIHEDYCGPTHHKSRHH